MPSDYGMHWMPESEWIAYDTCYRCKAERGKPCLDMRYRHMKPKQLWLTHPHRKLISVFDGHAVAMRAGLIEDAT